MAVQKTYLLNNPVQLVFTGGINPKGVYNNATTYATGDSVSYNGSSYVAIQATTGNLPTNTTYWQLLASGSASNLSLEIPSGTVNGINTTFTTIYSPVFVEVSGQIMVSDVNDPTNYGYTIIGSSPYTLTFTNAPTQTPHSFHNL